MEEPQREEERRAALKWRKMTDLPVGFSTDTRVKNPTEGGPTVSSVYAETTDLNTRLNLGEQGAGPTKGAETTLPIDNDVPVDTLERQKLLKKRKSDRNN